MADMCEICMKLLEHWNDGIPNYDSAVLCSKCSEEVNEIYYDGSDKEFEDCVEIVRKRKNEQQEKN